MKRKASKPRIAKPVRSVLVEIEKPIYGGAFLARLEGKATFVPLTLPGEQARVRIMEEKSGYATAEPEEIVSGAPERVVPHCRHFGACGGCQYQHASYEAQLAFKQAILRETLERGGVRAPEKIEVLAGNPWQYRNRIRLALDSAGRVGYRARRSHDLVPIAECPDCRAAAGEGSVRRRGDIEGGESGISCEGNLVFLECRRNGNAGEHYRR